MPAPKEMERPGRDQYFGRGDQLAVALGHHAPDGRDAAAGRGLGQGLDTAAGDHGQLRGRDRRSFVTARRREQRPVRHRHGDRLLRSGRQVLGVPGRLRLPERLAVVPANIGLVTGAENAEEAKEFINLHLEQGRPATAAGAQDQPPADAALRRPEGARRLPRHPGGGRRRRRCSSTRSCRSRVTRWW